MMNNIVKFCEDLVTEHPDYSDIELKIALAKVNLNPVQVNRWDENEEVQGDSLNLHVYYKHYEQGHSLGENRYVRIYRRWGKLAMQNWAVRREEDETVGIWQLMNY